MLPPLTVILLLDTVNPDAIFAEIPRANWPPLALIVTWSSVTPPEEEIMAALVPRASSNLDRYMVEVAKVSFEAIDPVTDLSSRTILQF